MDFRVQYLEIKDTRDAREWAMLELDGLKIAAGGIGADIGRQRMVTEVLRFDAGLEQRSDVPRYIVGLKPGCSRKEERHMLCSACAASNFAV